MSSIFGRPIVYLGFLGLLITTVTLLLGWLYIPNTIPIVLIAQGKLQGIIVDRSDFPKPVEAYLGIPYALPPVGNLRFSRPQPVLVSNETFEASRFGPRWSSTIIFSKILADIGLDALVLS